MDDTADDTCIAPAEALTCADIPELVRLIAAEVKKQPEDPLEGSSRAHEAGEFLPHNTARNTVSCDSYCIVGCAPHLLYGLGPLICAVTIPLLSPV